MIQGTPPVLWFSPPCNKFCFQEDISKHIGHRLPREKTTQMTMRFKFTLFAYVGIQFLILFKQGPYQ